MNSILITGCNRGLGLGLVKTLVALPQPPQHLFTTCRSRAQATVSSGETSDRWTLIGDRRDSASKKLREQSARTTN